MRIAAIILMLCGVTPAWCGPPDLPILEGRAFGVDDLVRSANTVIALGEEQGVDALKALSKHWDEDFRSANVFSINERLSWVCLLVFDPNEERVFRGPRYGGLSLPYLSMHFTSWPLYPVAVSEGVPFVLSEGYSLHGVAEDPIGYIERCRKQGQFRKKALPVPTHAQAEGALEALFVSERWKAIRWKHSEKNIKYTYSQDWVKEFLRQQVAEMKRTAVKTRTLTATPDVR